MTRHIRLEGIDNLRDYGDYPGAKGRMKRGVLYRSASHANATDADLETLKALGIDVIVDLRRPQERQREPSRRWPGFAGQVIASDVAHEGDDPWQAFMKGGEISFETLDGWMHEYYRVGPYEPRHIDAFSRYFQALATTDGAVLIHCAAGKDRTGMLAAFTHHLAGLSDADIVADYMLTNNEETIARRLPGLKAHFQKIAGRDLPDETVRIIISVAPRHLETAMTAITQRSGSLDNYLETVLGVDAKTRDAIEAKILV
jgi:protein-tyrosine phosphatase